MATITLVRTRRTLSLGLVMVWEAFGHDGRGGGDDQGNCEHDFLHRWSPLGFGQVDLRFDCLTKVASSNER
jgi:hypothetical protein